MSESTPAPIPLEDAIKAVQVAMEMEKKVTKGPYRVRETRGVEDGHEGEGRRVTVITAEDEPWSVFEACLAIEGDPELDNAAFVCLARNTYRSMLEYLNEFLLFEAEIHTDVDESYGMYGMLSALISHLDATVPDWRVN